MTSGQIRSALRDLLDKVDAHDSAQHDQSGHTRRRSVANCTLANVDLNGPAPVKLHKQLFVWRSYAALAFGRVRDAVTPRLDDFVRSHCQQIRHCLAPLG
jgi:hypothetical protein